MERMVQKGTTHPNSHRGGPFPRKCSPSPPGLLGDVVPARGRPVAWGAYVCVFGKTEPQSFVGSLGAPRRLFTPFGFLGLRLVGCCGFPCLPPQHRHGTPSRSPPPPSPRPTLGGRPAPLRVAPLTSRRGAGGGGLARLPAPRRLQDPDRSAPACCSGDPGPGRPLPLPPAALTPGSVPGPTRAPRPPQGTPARIAPPSLLPGPLSPSLCPSLCLAQGVWVSASSARGLGAPRSPSVSARPTSARPAPQSLSWESGGSGARSLPLLLPLSVRPLGRLGVPSVCSPARLRTAQPRGLGAPPGSPLPPAPPRAPAPVRARLGLPPSSLSGPPPSSGPRAPSRIPALPSLPAPPLLRRSQ